MKKFIVFLFAGIILTACDGERLNTKEFAKELKEKKIKRVTDGEISSSAMKLGNLINDTISNLLKQNICELNQQPVIKNFETDFDAKVAVYTVRDTNNMDLNTKLVFQATEYGFLKNLKEASIPNLQYLKNGYWLYSRPLKQNECNTTNEFKMLSIVISQAEIIKKLI